MSGITDGQCIVKVFTEYDPPIIRILVPTVPEITPINFNDPVEILEPPVKFISYKKSSVKRGLFGVKFVTYTMETE